MRSVARSISLSHVANTATNWDFCSVGNKLWRVAMFWINSRSISFGFAWEQVEDEGDDVSEWRADVGGVGEKPVRARGCVWGRFVEGRLLFGWKLFDWRLLLKQKQRQKIAYSRISRQIILQYCPHLCLWVVDPLVTGFCLESQGEGGVCVFDSVVSSSESDVIWTTPRFLE